MLLIILTLLFYSRMLLSELHHVYFEDPAHAQKVLTELRGTRPAKTLMEVVEVCYLEIKIQFLPP